MEGKKDVIKHSSVQVGSASLNKETCEETIKSKHEAVSNIDTPKFYVKERQGFDYVEESYMRHLLNKHFPIWSWDIIKYEFLGADWVVVHGKLTILDDGVARYYSAVSSHRIAKNRETGDFVDIGNNLKAANTDAFKVAINRLCNISDDIYRKRIEDISLSSKQKKYMMDLARNVGMEDRIEKAIETGNIHKHNASRTITQLEQHANKTKTQ